MFMARKIRILIISIMLALNSCSQDENNSVPQPVIHTDKYLLELTNVYSIKKVTFLSHSESENYIQEYYYFKDSVIIKRSSRQITYRTVYFLNHSGLADSCEYISNSVYSKYSKSKSYFSYNAEGYLTSKKDRSFNSDGLMQYEFTDTYEYTAGNLTRITIDPKRPSLTGKYIAYTYNSSPNLINIAEFTGPWLGKLNKNLEQSYFVGGSMSDYPPCSKYEYSLNSMGLVETKTILPCSSSIKNKTIITIEYQFTQKGQ
jgi:hypothetical protein